MVWERAGCDSGPFCAHYSVPAVSTPAGVFFPNFTRDDGRAVDFLAVLEALSGLMANRSCGPYFRLSVFEGRAVSESEGAERLETLHWYVRKAVLMLRHDCRPEISFFLDTPTKYQKYGLLRVTSVLGAPRPGPCFVNWTALYSPTPSYLPSPSSPPGAVTRCAGDMLGRVGSIEPMYFNQINVYYS